MMGTGSIRLKLMSATIAATAVLYAVTAAPASAQDITDKMKSWLFGPPAVDNSPGASANTAKEIGCPGVEVRNGAATLSIAAPGVEAGPMTTRYQVTIGDTARECAPLGGVMTMKVGVQGRVLLGPAGAPGQVDIPLRIVVVQEGVNPKTIVSKLYRVPVQVTAGQTSVPYAQVEQDLTFPMPSPAVLDAYVVYVGFDPSSAAAKAERKPAKPKKRE
jgi:hypothetical protein